jgi:gas vesicle protein
MMALASLIGAVAALLTAGYGIYKDAKGHKDNVEKIKTVTDALPTIAEDLKKVQMGWKAYQDDNKK